jgi:hypothetical protein
MDADGIRLLHLSGDARERGRRHGAEIPDLLRRYWNELVLDVTERSDQPMTETELRDWVIDRAAPALELAPDLEEEVRGIAEGGEVGFELALAVNLGEECNHLAYSRGWHSPEAQRCLSVIIPPSQSTTGGYLLAQTWDGPDWTPDPVLFMVEEGSGRSVYLADPGWVGGVGLNDRGLASVHTGVSTTIDGEPGLPYSFIARRIMQRHAIEDAARSVLDLPTTAGCHYVVVDGERVIDVETAGSISATLPYDGRLISTCAHFSDEDCSARQSDEGDDRVSRYRVERLLGLVSEHAPVGPLELFNLISDHQEGPDGAMVCRHPGKGRSLGGIVIDHLGRKVWGKAGNPCLARPVTEVQITSVGFDSRTFLLEEATPAIT